MGKINLSTTKQKEICQTWLNNKNNYKEMCDLLRNRLNEFVHVCGYDVIKLSDDEAFTLFAQISLK